MYCQYKNHQRAYILHQVLESVQLYRQGVYRFGLAISSTNSYWEVVAVRWDGTAFYCSWICCQAESFRGEGKRAKNLKELRESEAPNFPGELSSTTSNFQLNHHVKALLKTPAGNCDQDKFRQSPRSKNSTGGSALADRKQTGNRADRPESEKLARASGSKHRSHTVPAEYAPSVGEAPSLLELSYFFTYPHPSVAVCPFFFPCILFGGWN